MFRRVMYTRIPITDYYREPVEFSLVWSAPFILRSAASASKARCLWRLLLRLCQNEWEWIINHSRVFILFTDDLKGSHVDNGNTSASPVHARNRPQLVLNTVSHL